MLCETFSASPVITARTGPLVSGKPRRARAKELFMWSFERLSEIRFTRSSKERRMPLTVIFNGRLAKAGSVYLAETSPAIPFDINSAPSPDEKEPRACPSSTIYARGPGHGKNANQGCTSKKRNWKDGLLNAFKLLNKPVVPDPLLNDPDQQRIPARLSAGRKATVIRGPERNSHRKAPPTVNNDAPSLSSKGRNATVAKVPSRGTHPNAPAKVKMDRRSHSSITTADNIQPPYIPPNTPTNVKQGHRSLSEEQEARMEAAPPPPQLPDPALSIEAIVQNREPEKGKPAKKRLHRTPRRT